MTDSVYLNRDRSKVVEADSPEAAWKVHVKDAKRLGLLKEAPKGTKVVESANGTLDAIADKDAPTRRRKASTQNE